MHVWAPEWAQPWAPLLLNGFVVLVGFLILSGAVNTAMIGSNGVLNRVAEDGVVPTWFLKPHPKFGTTYRILYLILFLQLFTIVASRGNVIKLGEAYAFGVIWSFVFQALSMTILRFKDRRPREFKVPLNPKFGRFELPLGLILILLILLSAAVINLLTKEVATIGGVVFTTAFFLVFWGSERYHEKQRAGAKHEHLEQFNQATMPAATPESLGLTQPYRKLVAIRSPQNLFMLETALAETDPETTGVVVMTAKQLPPEHAEEPDLELDVYDQHLMTAVVNVAEKAGKRVKPVIVPTNNPLHAVVQMAKNLRAQELVMGASNKYTADEQLEQIAFFWITLHGGDTPPLTVRLLSRQRDVYFDLGGGNRIPKISERKAKSVAELRAAGVGVGRVLLAHDGSVAGSDMLQALMTMLDPDVPLGLICPAALDGQAEDGSPALHQDKRRARKLGRDLEVHFVSGAWAEEVVRVAREYNYDLIVLPLPPEEGGREPRLWSSAMDEILKQAPCRVFLAVPPAIPRQTDEEPPAARTGA
jgi:nucleotide-binding universal stress UspA family protein